jgi:hypothetical protein
VTSFPGSPRLLKAGIVLLNPDSGAIERIITLQYNPNSLSRTLQAQSIGAEGGGDRSEALRLGGPPVETFKLEAEIDAADQLEFPDQNETTVEFGIYPQLAALETMVYPPASRLIQNNAQASMGTLEIAPVESPLTLFVWSQRRVMPVRLTEFSITEEAFDPRLNPLRAKVSLGMRVLNVNDLGFDHKGGNLYMVYHQQLENLAQKAKGGALSDLGISAGDVEA